MTCSVKRKPGKLTVSLLTGEETFGMEDHRNEMVQQKK